MNEFQKHDLLNEIQKMMNGGCIQVHFALSLLSAIRRVNAFSEQVIALSALGKFKESDALTDKVMQASETVAKQLTL